MEVFIVNKSKKRVSLLLTGAMIFSAASPALYATELVSTEVSQDADFLEEVVEVNPGGFITSNTWKSNGATLHTADVADNITQAQQAIIDGLTSYSEEIDISEFNIHMDDISTLYRDLLANEYELFHVNGHIKYSYSPSTGYITRITPTYDIDESQYD